MNFLISDAWAQAGGGGGAGLIGLLPMVAIFVIFYFLLIRPQQKKAKEHRAMVADLSKGDEIVTNGLLAPAGAPGIALDNVTVSLIPDTDGDGDPDATDPDDDGDGLPDEDETTLGTNPLLADSDGNGTDDGEEDFDSDGQSNFAELVVTLTDPLDQQSRFVVRASPVPADSNAIRLSYPTVAGRDYLVERIQSDGVWTELPPAIPGDGSPAERDLPGGPLPGVSKYRVLVTLP